MTIQAYILRDWVYMQVSFAFIATFIIIFYFVVSSYCLGTSTRKYFSNMGELYADTWVPTLVDAEWSYKWSTSSIWKNSQDEQCWPWWKIRQRFSTTLLKVQKWWRQQRAKQVPTHTHPFRVLQNYTMILSFITFTLFTLTFILFKYSKSSWSHWLSLLSSSEYRLRLIMLIPPWFAVGMSSYRINFSVR